MLNRRKAKKRTPVTSSISSVSENYETREMMSAVTVDPNWFKNLNQPRNLSTVGQSSFIVQLKPNFASSPADAQAKLGRAGVTVVSGLGSQGTLLVNYRGTAAALSRVAGVATAAPNRTARATAIDPLVSQTWGHQKIGAEAAWSTTPSAGQGAIVAVIDTGIDFSHPDLQSKIYRNGGEVAGNGVDDDQNGFVDDVTGYDFINNDNLPADDDEHGTHVSGTIAAAQNDLGMQGIAFNASILPLKVLDHNGNGTYAEIIRGINYATLLKQRGANIVAINASLGGRAYFKAFEAAVAAAGDAGIAVIAAAGNSKANTTVSPEYPAAFDLPNVVSVAATTVDDKIWDTQYPGKGSNYGPDVDIAAPGHNILSTVPGGGYARFTGTSMAAPHVAGVFAMLRGVAPSVSMQQAIDALFQGADLISDLNVRDGRRLNAARSVSSLAVATPVAPFGTQAWNSGTAYRGFMVESEDFFNMAGREAKLRELASWNVNVVRWQINLFDNKSVSAQFADLGWKLSTVVEDFRKAGISMILDVHPLGGLSKKFGTVPAQQAELINGWKQLASRFGSNSVIAGYDLLNEPEMTTGEWSSLAQRLVTAIRQVDGSTPIVVQPANLDPRNVTKLPRFSRNQNVVYGIHMYDPQGYTHQGLRRDENRLWQRNVPYDNQRKARAMDSLQAVRQWQETFPESERPRIFVGEFSVVRDFQDLDDIDNDGDRSERQIVQGTTEYLRDCINKFEEYGWDWTYHAYDESPEWDLRRGNQNDLGVFQEAFRRNSVGLTNGMKIHLKTYNGSFICAESGGGGEVNATRPWGGHWETFEIVVLDSEHVALRSATGHYVCAESGGGGELVANRPIASTWERFKIHRLGGNRIALQTSNGAFVCAEGGGGGILVANRSAIQGWETFEFQRLF